MIEVRWLKETFYRLPRFLVYSLIILFVPVKLGSCRGHEQEASICSDDLQKSEVCSVYDVNKLGNHIANESEIQEDVPRFVINSPFQDNYVSPIPAEGMQLWATSRLWEKAPDFVVEKWITTEPERNGKYLLIEFWATWCRQCKLTIPRLNAFHQRFGKDLVVIGISDESEQVIRSHTEPAIDYYLAIDTLARMKNELAVISVPHVIVVEPGGYVVWEGFPLLKDHELTEDVIGKIIQKNRDCSNKTE
ncbi:MAG: TlpA family protein disulfide reductase [Phycisphaerae bacterium]|nr:TlpA family protein disulfide reductase [Phycisphaerae bacterium]